MKPLVVCIAGPTACGKTAAAVAVCRALNGEVISMDSMQIYRGMDVGTAKPSASERGGIPHHMIDILPPTAAYSVSEYQRDAGAVAAEILSRGKLPVFAGGTGLYLQAVKHPMRFAGVDGDETVRSRLRAQAENGEGRDALWRRLCAEDPKSAAHLHPNDVRRVVRALEVLETTGRPMGETDDWKAPPEYDFLTMGIRWPREVLRARIEERVSEMARRGLADEVRRLQKAGVTRSAQSMQAIGYKEICEALAGECTMEKALALVNIHTRQYAKKQMTWLARDEEIEWFDADTFPNAQALHEKMIARIRAYQEERKYE